MCTARLCVLVSAASRWCFSSHSRRPLKQRAFSVNLSISAATPLTAGRRAGGGVGRVQYKQARVCVRAPGERGGRRRVPVYVNEDAGEVGVGGCRGAGGGQSSFYDDSSLVLMCFSDIRIRFAT